MADTKSPTISGEPNSTVIPPRTFAADGACGHHSEAQCAQRRAQHVERDSEQPSGSDSAPSPPRHQDDATEHEQAERHDTNGRLERRVDVHPP